MNVCGVRGRFFTLENRYVLIFEVFFFFRFLKSSGFLRVGVTSHVPSFVYPSNQCVLHNVNHAARCTKCLKCLHFSRPVSNAVNMWANVFLKQI